MGQGNPGSEHQAAVKPMPHGSASLTSRYVRSRALNQLLPYCPRLALLRPPAMSGFLPPPRRSVRLIPIRRAQGFGHRFLGRRSTGCGKGQVAKPCG